MFILMKSGLGLYLGHLESGTRSLGQIIEKHCVDNRGHSFHLILMSQVSDSGPSWPSCLILNLTSMAMTKQGGFIIFLCEKDDFTIKR